MHSLCLIIMFQCFPQTPLEEKTCSACRRTVKDVIWKLRDPRMKVNHAVVSLKQKICRSNLILIIILTLSFTFSADQADQSFD